MVAQDELGKPAYCIFIDTVCEGRVPLVRDQAGKPVLFDTRGAAEREIADNLMTRLQEYMDGERDFESAVEIEEYILPVDVFSDGSIFDEDGYSHK